MTDKLCRGTCAIWDDDKGTGWIMFADESGAASVCRDDLRGNSLNEGDNVEFYVTKQHNTKRATCVKRCMDAKESFSSHNNKSDNNSNNKKTQQSQGILYFQTGFYDAKQMQNINDRFSNNIHAAPKMLFGDNYIDRMRNNNTKRQEFGGQSKIMGHWDRKYGFGIPTQFDNAGFINNDHNFRALMKHLFKELKSHLLNGGDVCIPYPSTNDLTQRQNKYFKNGWVSKGKQMIFHNLGTGISSLSFDRLLIIQKNIDELKQIASRTKNVSQLLYNKNQANYQQKSNTPQENINIPKSSRGLLISQTDWYNKQQMEYVYNHYNKHNALDKAPKMLFGDNDTDNKRSQHQRRRFFGGMAGVMGKYDKSISYGIVTTFFNNRTPNIQQFKSIMDKQFKPLRTHLLNGHDVVIPTPSHNDILQNKHRYYKNGKQVIFHNIGTGIASLRFEYIQYIQIKIDELSNVAKNTRTVNYYKANYSIKRNEEVTVTEQKSSENWVCSKCFKVMQINDELCAKCMQAKTKQISDTDIAKKMQKKYDDEAQKMKEANANNVQQLQQKNATLQERLNNSQKEFKDIKTKFEELEKDNSVKLTQAKCNDKQQKNQNLEKELIATQNKLKEIESKSEQQKERSQILEKANETLKDDKNKSEQQSNVKINELKKHAQMLETKNKTLTSENKVLNENILKLQNELKEIQSKLEQQKKRSQILEKDNETLKDDKNKSEQKSNAKITELEKRSRMLETKNEALTSENKVLNENVLKLKNDNIEFQKQLQTLEKENQTLKMNQEINEKNRKEQKVNEHETTDGYIDINVGSDNDIDLDTSKYKHNKETQNEISNPTDESVANNNGSIHGNTSKSASYQM